MDPRVQSDGGEYADNEEPTKGLSSSLVEMMESGSRSPSHSHSQHNCLRSSMPKVVENPEYVAIDMWFRTLRIIPESDVGEIAHVANAWERACCNAF